MASCVSSSSSSSSSCPSSSPPQRQPSREIEINNKNTISINNINDNDNNNRNNDDNNQHQSVHYRYPPERRSDFIIKLTIKKEMDGKEEQKGIEWGEGEMTVYYHVHKSRLEQRAKYFETLFESAEKNNEDLNEMELELLEGVNTTELFFKDYLSHIYFASPTFTTIIPHNIVHFLDLSRYFDDSVLYEDCRRLLFSDEFEQSSAFRGGYFDLCSIACQYSIDGLTEHCITKLKEKDCMTATINRIKNNSLSSLTTTIATVDLSELFLHYIEQINETMKALDDARKKIIRVDVNESRDRWKKGTIIGLDHERHHFHVNYDEWGSSLDAVLWEKIAPYGTKSAVINR